MPNPSGDPLKNPCKLVLPFALAIDLAKRLESPTSLPTTSPLPGSAITPNPRPSRPASPAAASRSTVSATSDHQQVRQFRTRPPKNPRDGGSGKGQLRRRPRLSSKAHQRAGQRNGQQTPVREGGSRRFCTPTAPRPKSRQVYGKGVFGPWAVSVDGNDNIWVSNFSSAQAGIVELCGFRTENCPSGMKTGDAISPPGGYVGGGLQLQVDVGIGPAGDVVGDQQLARRTRACYGKPKEVVSTLWRWARSGSLFRHGEASPHTADRATETTVRPNRNWRGDRRRPSRVHNSNFSMPVRRLILTSPTR